MIISLHVTHSSAGISAVNELCSLIDQNVKKYLVNIMENNEYVILRTCNRFEIYVSSDNAEHIKNELDSFVKIALPYSNEKENAFILHGKDSIKHLFRVSCGLDSLMVGEDQIQGQVREAYIRSKEEGHVSRSISNLFDKALAVGKRVRSETYLNGSSISIGSAAVELAESIIGDIKGKTVAVIGAGEMATLIAKSLMNKGPNAIFVSSRTFENASILAAKLNGTAVSMDHLIHTINKSDLVLVATSAPHMIITKDIMEKAMEGRPSELLVIDVSLPKNVDNSIRTIPKIKLETMEGLQAVAAENIRKRKEEIGQAERIITEEMEKIDKERLEEKADVIISGISRKVAVIREEELSKAKLRASSSDVDDVFDDFSRVLISRILADTYDKLREASRSGNDNVCEAANDLFGLEVRRCSQKE